MPRFCASSIRSKYTLPEQATTRLTFFALPAVLSAITVWKPPSASSASDDTASLWRSSDLGLITTSGLREIGRASCRERVCQNVYISVVAVPLKKKKYTMQKKYDKLKGNIIKY